MKKPKLISGEVPTNGAKESIEMGIPYTVSVTIVGTADLLFHRWNCEGVEEQSNAKRGSKEKKTDKIENYVYRNEKKEICLPSEYLRMSIINAAKYKTDPRSTRKSAMDLYKAGIICDNELASLGTKIWDKEDKRRVVIQKAGINRVRPAMNKGWKATFQLTVNIPEYITKDDLHDTITIAGKLVGVGDFRPSYGRFRVDNFEVL